MNPGPPKTVGRSNGEMFCSARQTLLLRRHDLADLDGRNRHELLIHQISSRQAAVERWPTFAQQVLHAQFLAQLSDRQRQIERLSFTRRNDRDMRMAALRAQTRGCPRAT